MLLVEDSLVEDSLVEDSLPADWAPSFDEEEESLDSLAFFDSEQFDCIYYRVQFN